MNKQTLKILGLGAIVAVTLAALRAKKSFKEIKEEFDKEVREALSRPDKILSEAKKVLNAEGKTQIVKAINNLKKKVKVKNYSKNSKKKSKKV